MSKKKNEHFSGFFDVMNVIPVLASGQCDLHIIRVIYNDPATIVFWSDGSKTTSKCMSPDKYDPKIGLLLATLKRFGKASDLMEDWAPTSEGYPNHVEIKDVRARHK